MSILHIFIVILTIIPFIVVGVVAHYRGRNICGWLFLTVVLSPTVFVPWIIVVIILISNRGDSNNVLPRDNLEIKHREAAAVEYKTLAPVFIARYLEDEPKHSAITSLAEIFEAIGDPYSDKVALVQKIKLLLPLM